MSIDFPSDLDEEAWAKLRRAPDKCRGAACQQAIATHFGKSARKVAELEVACGFTSGGDDSTCARGTIRRWTTSGKLPSKANIAVVRRMTNGAVDLSVWTENRLFELIRRELPGLPRLNLMLEQSSAPVRRILTLEPDKAGRYSHHTPDRRTTLELRHLGGLDAFVAMLCLARRAEWLDDMSLHALPALCAFDMFPRVLIREPDLQFRWEALYDCLNRIFWNRVYVCGLRLDLSLARMQRNVAAVLANREARYPYISPPQLNEEREVALQKFLLDFSLEMRAYAREVRSSDVEFRLLQKTYLDAVVAEPPSKGQKRRCSRFAS